MVDAGPRPALHDHYWESMESDAGLESMMVRYQAGDFAAATTLVQRVSPQLHRFFLVQFLSRRHADDLLQETWLRIHEVRHTYRPDNPLLPWIYAIARHVRVDHFRKAQRTELREHSLDESFDVAHPSTAATAATTDLEALLATLPESQREVIAMLKVSGMSLEEVACATASTVGSVKQKAHRAYERLRGLLSGTGVRNLQKGGGA